MTTTALLEEKLAFLEQAVEELGSVVYAQQREIDELRRRLAAAEQAFDTLKTDLAGTDPAAERPPHY